MYHTPIRADVCIYVALKEYKGVTRGMDQLLESDFRSGNEHGMKLKSKARDPLVFCCSGRHCSCLSSLHLCELETFKHPAIQALRH